MRYPVDLKSIGVGVLAARHVPGPPAPPYAVGVGYPLALDICGRIAAVSFAALDVYPDIARGWWCLVEQFSLQDGTWGFAGGEHDNTTTPTPFKRPARKRFGRAAPRAFVQVLSAEDLAPCRERGTIPT